MNDNAVAIAALGVLATMVGLMVWVVKKVLSDIKPALDKHSEAAEKIVDAIGETKITSVEQAKSNKYVAEALLRRVESDKNMMKTIDNLGVVIKSVGEGSVESLKFMKKLNGKLENAIVQKVTEQHVEHQTIENKE